ncbi:MAG: hypothetical protein R3A79_20430 [Nannocystaceae bacterium]
MVADRRAGGRQIVAERVVGAPVGEPEERAVQAIPGAERADLDPRRADLRRPLEIAAEQQRVDLRREEPRLALLAAEAAGLGERPRRRRALARGEEELALVRRAPSVRREGADDPALAQGAELAARGAPRRLVDLALQRAQARADEPREEEEAQHPSGDEAPAGDRRLVEEADPDQREGDVDADRGRPARSTGARPDGGRDLGTEGDRGGIAHRAGQRCPSAQIAASCPQNAATGGPEGPPAAVCRSR